MMKERDNRDEMVIATKYTTPYMGAQPDKIQSNFSGNGAKSMKLSLEASLEKLQTTYVDILYVHWWDYSTSIPEMMHSFNDLVVAGKVLYLGVSDTPAWVVSKANQYARDHGLRQFVLYQGLWNAAKRDFERDIIPMALDEGIALAPWGPIGEGKFKPKDILDKASQSSRDAVITETDRKVSAVLKTIAGRKSATIYQIAIAYVMLKTPYVFPIVGCTKAEHLESNIAALGVQLSLEDINEIEVAYPFDHGFPHTFLSGSHFECPGAKSRQAQGLADVMLTKFAGTTLDWVDTQKAVQPVN